MRQAMVIALGLTLLSATAAAASPIDLAHKLRVAPYLRSQLPPGFSVGSTSEVQQADGQAAEVKVGLKYEGDSDGYIEYFAFRNTSVAASQFAGVTHPSPSSGWRVVPGRLPGSSLPSRMLQQTLTTAPFGPSHTITDRLNALVVRQDAVVIYVLTEHRYVKGLTARRGYNPGLNAKSGDMNIPLMRSALAHLASAQKPV